MLGTTRLRLIHGVLVVFSLAIVVRAAQVQLWQHERWTKRALQQQFTGATLPPVRGDIEDVTGLSIARSPELVRLAVAPAEVRDLRRLYRAMVAAGISQAEARRATNRRSRWVELRRAWPAAAVAGVSRFNGVHTTAVGGREYIQSEGARRLLGGLSRDGAGASGLELQFDTLLRGRPGTARTIRGVRGARFESPEMLSELSRNGHTVRLTINQALQDICDKSLADAVSRSSAEGGDVIVTHPRSGELLCVASRRRGVTAGSASAFIEPFEPGSTLKPFYAGMLMDKGLARPDEVIETFGGRLALHGRTITDVHRAERLSLADVIRHSSNVGIVRFSERLSDGDLYQLLRDLGFGTPSGIAFPSEAAGMLSEPRRWSRQSRAALAMGYELAVTPLQLATAYSTLANGGELMEPALIREIRDNDGTVIYRHRPRSLRRVFSDQSARTMLSMLESVVDSGTATEAGLATFSLAGKSGTAWRTRDGVYAANSYTATFVALFPAESPQYVVLAKLDNPRGASYYGGKAAAPIAKAVIEGALAARDASLDWERLAPARVAMAPESGGSGSVVAAGSVESAAGAVNLPTAEVVGEGAMPETGVAVPVTFVLSDSAANTGEGRGDPVVVPDLGGLPLRSAVRRLHEVGLKAIVSGAGPAVQSVPPGATVARGTTVRIRRP
ncbi:MAG: penicillin-binding transpeptidase domain-containing protein [Gemmatimonadota bacterium]